MSSGWQLAPDPLSHLARPCCKFPVLLPLCFKELRLQASTTIPTFSFHCFLNFLSCLSSFSPRSLLPFLFHSFSDSVISHLPVLAKCYAPSLCPSLLSDAGPLSCVLKSLCHQFGSLWNAGTYWRARPSHMPASFTLPLPLGSIQLTQTIYPWLN